ncbi:MAG TPA: DUF29 domain-containing protein [Stellaceae bacterium]|nr:DUF29 domain-containing protein [Stellaceae bacterium]
MPDVKTLYDQDFVTWAEQQAEALRAAGRGTTNQPLDWENLAEEIEDLAKRDRRELHSQVRRIVEHLFKLQYSPAVEPRAGWRGSVRNARAAIQDVIDDSPSLRTEMREIIDEETKRGAQLANAALADFGKLTDELRAKSFLDLIHYADDQILGDWFPPEPQG